MAISSNRKKAPPSGSGPASKGRSQEKNTAKQESLTPYLLDHDGEFMTSDQGLRIEHTDDSLKAGVRGPSLLEDFHLREKITHFDHERIPERVVHARGSAAHGVFQVYESQADLTQAGFLQDPKKETPVFVRFSTVGGSRGSADTVRDVRGFAVKFYTEQGNFDLVGNNIPVFFIQDGIKFPDLIHSAKPEPHHEMPQASTAHDTFWDFISLVPESTHMAMWILSDRAIPKSYATMEGFGVHTFRLVNAKGKARFVKFHWKPLAGIHSLVRDEAQKLSGKDPDFHRRDLWELIDRGQFPEYELGVQVIEEKDADKFDFDLLDPTKLVPEEMVPVRRIGKMTLNRNPENFFAETEQVAFHVGHLVPGIDVTNDPLMQARLFSYLDTQLTRLGGPNFAQIPINQPLAPVHNHQQDGFMRTKAATGRANYHPNSTGGGCPFLASMSEGGFVNFPEPVQGVKTRERSPSFGDHFSQATLFYKSMSQPEKDHMVEAARFELGKVEIKEIRSRMLGNFAQVDAEFAALVAAGIGVPVPKISVPRGKDDAKKANGGKATPAQSPALSIVKRLAPDSAKKPGPLLAGRKIAFLIEEGFRMAEFEKVKQVLTAAGAVVEPIATRPGDIRSAEGKTVEAPKTFLTSASLFYDAVYVVGGLKSAQVLSENADALHFVEEAFRHSKTIGATSEGADVILASRINRAGQAEHGQLAGVLIGGSKTSKPVAPAAFAESFANAISLHRHWDRAANTVPA